LETRSYTNPSRPATISRRSETRIEELTNQLNPGNKEKSVGRSALRDAKFQSAELERQRARMEEEKKLYESQISALRQAMDAMVAFLSR
jgi:myosin protein heavy chain